MPSHTSLSPRPLSPLQFKLRHLFVAVAACSVAAWALPPQTQPARMAMLLVWTCLVAGQTALGRIASVTKMTDDPNRDDAYNVVLQAARANLGLWGCFVGALALSKLTYLSPPDLIAAALHVMAAPIGLLFVISLAAQLLSVLMYNAWEDVAIQCFRLVLFGATVTPFVWLCLEI